MIEHMHPRMARSNVLGEEDVRHLTRKAHGEGVGGRLVANYDAMNAAFGGRGKMAAGAAGFAFELALYDTLVHHGVKPELVQFNVDLSGGRNTEVDLLVAGRVAVFAKTSLRERWKQVDRDLLGLQFVSRVSLDPWCVFLREKPEHTLAQCHRKARAIEAQSFSLLRVITALDESAMRELVDACTR